MSYTGKLHYDYKILIIFFKIFFTEYDHKTQPKLTLPNQNYGRNVPKPYS